MNHFHQINLPKLADQHWANLNERPRKDSENILDRLQQEICPNNNKWSDAQKEFLSALNNNEVLEQIIKAKPCDLECYADNLNLNWFWDGEKTTALGTVVQKIFNYEGFRGSKHCRWLAESLKVRSCLYCNAQYTISTSTKAYHTFDHFFPKARYPYLSVSFYNLLPACSTCNQAKGNQETSLETDWHPYHHDFDIMSKFQLKTSPASTIEFALNKYKEHKDLKIVVKQNDDSDKIVKKHLEMFKLAHQYEVHTDVAAETIWKSLVYNNSYKRELLNLGIHLTAGEINRIILGNYSDPEEVYKRPLSKLTSDLAKDLGLI